MQHKIVTFFQTLFLGSLLFGTGIRIPIYQGAYIYPHDCTLLLYYLSYIFVYGKNISFNQTIVKPMCLFLGIASLSLLINIFRFPVVEGITGAMYLLRILFYGFLFIIVSNDKKAIEWMKKLYVVGIVFAFIGFIQFLWYPNLRNLEYIGWDPHYYRLFSTLFDPNLAGIFLGLTFLTGWMFITKNNRIWMALIQGIILMAIILTISRSALLSVFGASVFIILYKKAWNYILMLCLSVTVIFLLPVPNKSITPLFRQETGLARLNNWSESVNLISARPVFGQGFNLLRSIFEPNYSQIGTSLSHAGAGVDNSFLFVLLTTGIVGGIAFLYLIYYLWILGVRLLQQRKNNQFGIVYASSLFAVSIHSLFNNSLFYPWIFLWLMILLGTGEVMAKKEKI